MSNWQAKERQWALWMKSAQAGDEDAYTCLLTELAEAIRAYLLSRFGKLEMLDDCIQESLLAIHRARHTYNSERTFRPWMFAIVRHKAIDMLRHQGTRSRKIDAEFTLQSDGQEPEILPDPSELLEALPSDHREAILLTKFWGYSVRETAGRLGVSENLVKVWVHRGIRKMRMLLESETV